MPQDDVALPDVESIYVVLHDLVLRANGTEVALLMTQIKGIHSVIGWPCPTDPVEAALSLREVAQTLWLQSDLEEDELDRQEYLGRKLYMKFAEDLFESLQRDVPSTWSFDPRFNPVSAGFEAIMHLADLDGDHLPALKESVDAMYRHLRVNPPGHPHFAVRALETICLFVIQPATTSTSRKMDPRHLRVWNSLDALFRNHGPNSVKQARAAATKRWEDLEAELEALDPEGELPF